MLPVKGIGSMHLNEHFFLWQVNLSKIELFQSTAAYLLWVDKTGLVPLQNNWARRKESSFPERRVSPALFTSGSVPRVLNIAEDSGGMGSWRRDVWGESRAKTTKWTLDSMIPRMRITAVIIFLKNWCNSSLLEYTDIVLWPLATINPLSVSIDLPVFRHFIYMESM